LHPDGGTGVITARKEIFTVWVKSVMIKKMAHSETTVLSIKWQEGFKVRVTGHFYLIIP
jgi:hypothetical protein